MVSIGPRLDLATFPFIATEPISLEGIIPLKCILFANTDWYLYNFRRSLATALRESGHEILLVSPPGPYGEKLEALGFRWIAAPMERSSLNPLRELTLLGWLWRLMRREQPDVVHGFTIKCAVYGALVGRLVGAGRVNAVAGMGYVFISDSVKARLLRPSLRLLMRAALGGDRARLILQNPDDVQLFERARIVPSGEFACCADLASTALVFFRQATSACPPTRPCASCSPLECCGTRASASSSRLRASSNRNVDRCASCLPAFLTPAIRPR